MEKKGYNKKKTSANSRKKRFSFKLLMIFLAFEFIFSACTAPFIVYYGPFQNLKKVVVGTAMATMSHKYFATAFLSQEKIDEILNGSKVHASEETTEALDSNKQNINDIKISNSHDSSIQLKEINGDKFDGYMLVVKDPARLRVGYTSKLGKEGQKTSKIAADNNAVAAINAGGFEGGVSTGTGATPSGMIISGGKVVYKPSWIDENEKSEGVMGFTSKGLLVVGSYSINELLDMNVSDAVSFGPTLIMNGRSQISSDGGQGYNPRTAIGQTKNGEILLLVIDGRRGLKEGATLKEVQNIMLQFGAHNAVNLDGGSTTTMYLDGEVVNTPCDALGERPTASIVYVKP